jgi:2-dehydropantoate 2-reductase
MKQKIAVVGAGAIGSLVGGLLAHAGEDVTLIARKPHVEAVSRDGLFINGVLGEFTVKVEAAEQLDFRSDIVLLTAKAQDVEAVCKKIKPYAQGIPIVALQNGVRSDEMAASVFGKENIIGCVVYFSAAFLQPGAVTYGLEGSLLIGNAFGPSGERVREIAAILSEAIRTDISDYTLGAKWTKLIMNAAGNSLSAVTGLDAKMLAEQSELSRIAVHMMKEALEVAEKAEIKLGEWPGFSLSAFKRLVKGPLAEAATQFASVYGNYGALLSSTLQSILRGKPTEIDYINGEIVTLGEEIGVPTPWNSKVVELVHAVQETREFLSPEDAVRAFSSCRSGGAL